MAFKAKITIDPEKLLLCLDHRYDVYSAKIGRRIIMAAKAAFIAQEKHGNEWRTSVTSPPKYLASFKTRRVGKRLLVINDDPAWSLIEYGAHPGGDGPKVLRYRPLYKGLIAVVI